MAKCSECGGNMVAICEDYTTERNGIGAVTVPALEFLRCDQCGDVLLPWDAAGRIEQAAADRLVELLEQLPIGEFITAADAWSILGKTKQAFHQNTRIRRGFIYSVPRGEGGERFYHRRSVELFGQTGDGRFPLVQDRTGDVEFVACAESASLQDWLVANAPHRSQRAAWSSGAVPCGAREDYELCQA